MRIKTVSVAYERKVNLGDYNSATAACSIWANVEPTDDLDQVMHAMWEMARDNVRPQIAGAMGKSVDYKQTFLGLPYEEPVPAPPVQVNLETGEILVGDEPATDLTEDEE